MIKKISLCALSVCTALSASVAWGADGDYQLEQVLMLSRHNLRAPLADNGSVLQQATKKSWPNWDVPGGQLTTKGGVLEVYMGKYTREWLAQQGLVKAGECPSSDAVYAYANSLQRTVATAQYFITGAFPGCDIQVSHQDEMGTMDPIFNPVITNGSDDFKKQALADMKSVADKLTLKPAMQRLEKIIDYKSSPACDGKKQCDLTGDDANQFSAENGKEPGVNGPLRSGNALVDAFTLQYYEGMPADQVAWGQIKTQEQWKELSAIKNGYQDALFTSPTVAHNVAAPLVDYIRSMLIDQDKATAPKVTLMVGHDSNIASVLSALNVKTYTLPDQNEKTPIGGMVAFERWHDNKNNRDLVKVEYVYQSTNQLRDALPLSLDNPPKRVTLQMNDCPVDSNGYCSWDTFTSVLNRAIQGTPLEQAPAAQPAATPVADTAAANERVASEKAAADQQAVDTAAQAKASEEQAAADKAAAEKAAADKAAADKAAAEQAAKDKAEKAKSEKAAAEKAKADKAAAEKAAQDKPAADKAASQPAAPDASASSTAGSDSHKAQ